MKNNGTTTMAKEVMITPEVAEVMLTRNDCNRTINYDRVTEYANAMRNGRWKLNGETVIVDAHGTLLDGQHRLLACMEAETSFPTWVICGVEPEVFSTIDAGFSRSIGNMLGIAGIKDPNTTGAAVRLVLAWEAGWILDKRKQKAEIDREVVLERCRKDAEAIEHCVKAGRPLYKGTPGSNCTAAIALYYRIYAKAQNVPEEVAIIDRFFDGVKTGADLSIGDPRLALRKWCGNVKERDLRRDHVEHLGTYVRAWNSYLAGDRKTTAIRGFLRNGGEAFPTLKYP